MHRATNTRFAIAPLLLFILLVLSTAGCIDRELPYEVAPLTINPYGYTNDTFVVPAEKLDVAQGRSRLLARSGNPYRFLQADVEWVQGELDLAQDRQGQLSHIVTRRDYRNIGRFIPSLEQIGDGLPYWRNQLTVLRDQDGPYWTGQKGRSLADGHPEWVGACASMVNAMALKDSFIVLSIDNLERDKLFLLADDEQREPIHDLAVRKLHHQAAAAAYQDTLLDSLNQGRGIVFAEWSDLRHLIVKQDNIDGTIADWEEERSRIELIDRPYWNHQLYAAIASSSYEWILFIQHAMDNLDRYDELAVKAMADLECDRTLGQDPDTEYLQEFICRKCEFTTWQMAYFQDRIGVLVEGMCLGITESVP